jgi:hypothetical protein
MNSNRRNIFVPKNIAIQQKYYRRSRTDGDIISNSQQSEIIPRTQIPMSLSQPQPMHIESDTEENRIERAIKESILDEELRRQQDVDIEKALEASSKEIKEIKEIKTITTRKNPLDRYIETLCDDIDEIDEIDEEYTNTLKRKRKDITINTKTHIDFIVGRGKIYPKGCLNIPLNSKLKDRNIITIDPLPDMDADLKQPIQDVNFGIFGITRDQDPDAKIDVRIFFDWSSFYCGAMQSLTDIMMRIGRKCQIFVPLNNDENNIPGDVKRYLISDIFTLNLVEGHYPMFDWSYEINQYVNPNRYMRIDAYL